jgi:hypothetical protein
MNADWRSILFKSFPPIIEFILVIFAGFLLYYIAFSFFNIGGVPIFITLLLLPLIFYLIVSGKLQEFQTPLIGLKLQEAAKLTIVNSSISPLIGPIQALDKGGIFDIDYFTTNIEWATPLILKIKLTDKHEYEYSKMKYYSDKMKKRDQFKFVVFLNEFDELISFMPSYTFIDLFNPNVQYAETFIELLNDKNIEALSRFPHVYSEAFSENTLNTDALKYLEKNSFDSMLIVDKRKRIIGIVNREKIISDMILKIADIA